MKCFIDYLKDCPPLLSKFIRVNNVALCKTEELHVWSLDFLTLVNKILRVITCEFSAHIPLLPQHGFLLTLSHFLSVVKVRRSSSQFF